MNLVLSFGHPTKPAKALGPFQSFALDTETLRDPSTGEVIAYHRDRQWEVGEERYFRVDATTKVRIHFERGMHESRQLTRSRSFGPFGRFSMVEGLAYADDRVFAFADAKVGDWFCFDDGRHWAVMVVTDASAGTAKTGLTSIVGLAPCVGGVIALWEGAALLYLGRARSIRARLRTLASRNATLDSSRVTAVTWETHPNPMAREAELHAKYMSQSLSPLKSVAA
jgi:hypothetical protein